MKRRIASAIVAIGALALPAALLGGGEDPASAQRADRGYGQVVARDSAGDNPAAAVARTTLSNFGKVSYRITARPSDVKVDWGITSRCVKGPLIDYWPGPGDFRTTTKKAGFSGRYPIPLADPDSCTFAVAANTYKVGEGKRVTVKIYNQG